MFGLRRNDRVVTFGASSCLGNANCPWSNLERAAEGKYDFFLLLGDTVYADGSNTVEDYRQVWEDALVEEGLAALMASTSVVATFDDHECRDGFSGCDAGSSWYNASMRAMREVIPMRVTQMKESVSGFRMWRKISWGSVVDVFVLDVRSERNLTRGLFVSKMQADWLKAELTASRAAFKVIMNPVPITDMSPLFGNVEATDRWQGYSKQRTDLLEAIDALREKGTKGIVWIAGDFHFGMVAKIGAEGKPGAEVTEVLVGPAGSFISPAIASNPLGNRVGGQFSMILDTWSFTEFTADPGNGTLRMRFIDDLGTPLEDIVLKMW